MRKSLAPRLRNSRPESPRILFISTRGLNFHQLVDGIIAHGLQQRGARCSFFTCAGGLTLCDLSFEHQGLTPDHCEYCRECALKSIASFGRPKPYTLRGLLSDEEIRAWESRTVEVGDSPESFEYQGLPIGEIVRVSLCYILGRGTLELDEKVRNYYRMMVISACMLVDAYNRLIQREQPNRVVLLNGLWYPEQLMKVMAQRAGIPITSYEVGFRPGTLMIEHEGIACWMELDEEWRRYSQRSLEAHEEATLDTYLEQRWQGKGGVEIYWPSMQSDQFRIRERLNIKPEDKVVTLFPNLVWDTAVLQRDTAFTGLMEWVTETVKFFGENRKNDILVIRVHPAEARLWVPTNERICDALAKIELPPNVRVVGADEDISSYELIRMSDLGLVYASTLGLEMALMGRAVVVAGLTHYDGKGFTFGCRNKAEYFARLAPDGTPRLITSDEIQLARRYAYLLLFRYHIEFPYATIPAPAQPRVYLDSPDSLELGQDSEFDLLCKAILEGRDVLALRESAELAVTTT